MGGKGRKRREKNYMAAHGGGHNRLPPPPNRSAFDAVPAKLRKIMSFANPNPPPAPGLSKASVSTKKGSGRDDISTADEKQHSNSKDKFQSKSAESREGDKDEHSVTTLSEELEDDFTNNSTEEKKKKTKKRKRATDLRFEALEAAGVGSGRRERKKKRLKERKEKHKKTRSEDNGDFPGHEQIKFGDVVEAPPKLLTVPKTSKTSQYPSQERLRLKAIEAYRNRKGWTSRPGVNLAPPVLTSPAM